ncbi:MAG: cysteine hydrolase [Clostridiales bacterium]|nr:cysteine hydrolase [Clostridiales bacterium]
MEISFDERELASTLLCGQLEMNNKPVLMRASLTGKKTMLVVVDMIKGFCEKGALADPRCKAIAPAISGLIRSLPDADLIFVRDCHTQRSTEFSAFPPHCTDKESELIGEFSHFRGTDVPKNSTNAFVQLLGARSNLLEYDNVIVTGVCTDICVLQLALSVRAYMSEFNGHGNVVVFTDTVETYDAPTHNADFYNMTALKLMEQAGVQVFKKLA